MKKITLLIASLFITIGAMAQRPVLELTSGQIGTSYPYTLTDEDASKVFALEDLTVAVRINAPDALSGRMSLFATSAQDLAANSEAEGKNSRYVGYGLYNDKLAYLASWRGDDRFSTKTGISSGTNDVVIVYVINPTANTYKMYYNGVIPESGSYINNHTDGFIENYEIATPKMVKEDYENAKIYIGGAMNSSGAGEVFNGEITGVKVYNGALAEDEIAAITSQCFDDVKLYSSGASTDFATWEGDINNIVDGNTTNKWWSSEGQTIDKTVTVTLDELQSVGVIKWYFCDGDKPQGATIERRESSDGEWVHVADFTIDDIDENNIYACNAEGGNVKELRLRITKQHSNWLQIAEVELYNYTDDTGKTELQDAIAEAEGLWSQIVTKGKVKSDSEIDLAGKIYSNAGQNAADGNVGGSDDGAGIEGLLDNDPATYFHSRWGGTSIDEDHYLQIDLGEGQTLSDFVFEYAVRKAGAANNTSPAPTSIEVRVSEDGADFGAPIVTLTATDNNLPSHEDLGNTLWCSDVIEANKNVRYIRLTVTGSHGPGNNNWSGHYFFGMGTLNLYSTKSGDVIREECKSFITTQLFTEFGNALNNAKSINESNAVLSTEVAKATNELSKQINAIKAVIRYTLTVSDAGYATLFLGFDAAIPAGAEAYIVKEEGVNDTYISLTQVTGVLPANTGVIVKASSGSYEFVYSAEAKADVSANLLRGSVSDEYVQGAAYVLGNKEGVGLYKALLNKNATGGDGDTHFKNNANKAYLPASALTALQNTVAFYGFDWEGTTGIEQITDNREQSTAIYDLTGRRIESITAPGIYIVNGVKKLIR